jgi:hypothetical protein
VDDAYQFFFTEHRVKMYKKSSAINVVTREENSAKPKSEIAAFCLQL